MENLTIAQKIECLQDYISGVCGLDLHDMEMEGRSIELPHVLRALGALPYPDSDLAVQTDGGLGMQTQDGFERAVDWDLRSSLVGQPAPVINYLYSSFSRR